MSGAHYIQDKGEMSIEVLMKRLENCDYVQKIPRAEQGNPQESNDSDRSDEIAKSIEKELAKAPPKI